MSIVERAKNIILKPKTEWDVVVGEQTNEIKLYTGYIAILAAIPALATFIHSSVIGISVPFVGSIRMPVQNGLTNAVVAYVLILVGVYVNAFVISALAKNFGGVKDNIAALKLVAYSSTPSWLAGIFNLVPALSILGLIASLYGVYVMYIGLPKLMKSLPEKTVSYIVVSIIITIVVYLVVGAIAAATTTTGKLAGYGW